MNITITAPVTPEELVILSDMKGYQPTVSVTDDPNPTIDSVYTVVQNPISREEFVATQYRGLIIDDATKEYIRYAKKAREDAERAEEQAIRSSVESAITSTIA